MSDQVNVPRQDHRRLAPTNPDHHDRREEVMNAYFDNADRIGRTAAKGDVPVAHQANITAVAQLQATMALAYEQRTANLIALMSHCAKMGSFDAVESVGKTVLERLGLEE